MRLPYFLNLPEREEIIAAPWSQKQGLDLAAGVAKGVSDGC